MSDNYLKLRKDINELLSKTLGRRVTISDNTNIVQDLGLDSLAVMNICMALEDKFNIPIPLDRIADVRTIGDLVRTVQELQSEHVH
jgi:acyl carrier protein